MIRKLRHALRRFCGDRSGNATIEFVIIFPAFISLFLMAVEIGILTTRGVLLDRALDILVRDLRLGEFVPENHADLKAQFCSNGIVFEGCEDAIMIELTPFDPEDSDFLSATPVCRDREEEVEPVVMFEPGQGNEMMMIRACLLFRPFFPTAALAAQIKQDGTNEYALVSASAFVNEP